MPAVMLAHENATVASRRAVIVHLVVVAVVAIELGRRGVVDHSQNVRRVEALGGHEFIACNRQ